MAQDEQTEKLKPGTAAPAPVQNLNYVKPDPISNKGTESTIGSIAGAAESAGSKIYHLPETLASGTKNLAMAIGKPIVNAGIGAFNLSQQSDSSMRAPKPALTYEDVAKSYKDADFVTPVKKAVSGIFSGSPDQKIINTAPTITTNAIAQQPAKPTTILPSGVVDQAAPAVQAAQPAQFETTRTPSSAVSTEPKAPDISKEEIEKTAQERGQAVSRGSGRNFRYVQGSNGSVVKQNTDTGEVVPMSVQGITSNILKPGEESPLAREAKERKANAFREALMRQAFQPINGSTDIADIGNIKRNRKVAQQLLAQLDSGQMEEKRLAATERATTATQEQNRLAREQQAQYKQEKLGLDERKTLAAEKAAGSKATKESYKDKTFQGTPESISQQKQDYDRDLFQKSWAKENPQGTVEDDKVYKARQVLAANTKYPMYNKETNTPLKLRMDTEGNLYTQGPNGEAIPYM